MDGAFCSKLKTLINIYIIIFHFNLTRGTYIYFVQNNLQGATVIRSEILNMSFFGSNMSLYEKGFHYNLIIIINNIIIILLTKYIHSIQGFALYINNIYLILIAIYVLLKVVMFVHNIKLLQLFIIANILLQLIIFTMYNFLQYTFLLFIMSPFISK